jgi:hypothetical protein
MGCALLNATDCSLVETPAISQPCVARSSKGKMASAGYRRISKPRNCVTSVTAPGACKETVVDQSLQWRARAGRTPRARLLFIDPRAAEEYARMASMRRNCVTIETFVGWLCPRNNHLMPRRILTDP